MKYEIDNGKVRVDIDSNHRMMRSGYYNIDDLRQTIKFCEEKLKMLEKLQITIDKVNNEMEKIG